MITTDVLKVLKELGFIPEEIPEFGYSFDYEGLTFLYRFEDEDSKCLNITLPNVFEITEDNRVKALEAMIKLTGKIKFVQPYIMDEDSVWLCYQHYLGENNVTSDLLEHIIRTLSYSLIEFQKIITGEDNDN